MDSFCILNRLRGNLDNIQNGISACRWLPWPARLGAPEPAGRQKGRSQSSRLRPIRINYFHRSVVCLFLSAAVLTAAPSLTESALYDNSALWPPRAALTVDYTSSDADDPRTIPSRREAVLIRLEPDEPIHALLDFGRLGLHSVPLTQTDILERAEKIASGGMEKQTPNWTMMLGRGFSKLHPAPFQGGTNVPLTDLKDVEHFLIVYLDADPEAMRATAELLDQHAEALKEASTLPVIFGTGEFPYIGEPAYMKTLRENGMEKQKFIVPHVSVPYARSMDHSIPGSPAIVLVDAEGKTLYEPGSEATTITAMFTELEAYLDGKLASGQ